MIDVLRKLSAVVATAAVIALSAPGGVTAGGLQNEMDGLFGSMSNMTPPGVWNTQRRGVFAGGQFVAKNKIVNENIISLVPPSFSAGCGGIDFFGGSFSFINADQFVQLLRGVASNAAGYAFNLALGAMCPDCAAIMEQLQKKIQQLNQMFSNSCAMGKFLVDNTIGGPLESLKNEGGLINIREAVGDVFESMSDTTGKGPLEQADTAKPDEVAKKLKGNLVWRALKKQAVSGWFAYGDEAMLEAMMNVTGTVIVGDLETAPDGKGKSPKITPVPGNKIRFQDLIDGTDNGQNITILQCDTKTEDGCLNPTNGSLPLKGFKKMVRDKLLGDGGSPGLVQRIARNQGSLDAADQAFLSPQKHALAGLIFQLAKQGETGAVQFTEAALPHLAYDLATVMMEDLFKAVRAAVGTLEHPHAKALLEEIARSRETLRVQYELERAKIGSPTQLFDRYTSILEITRKIRYSATGVTVRN